MYEDLIGIPFKEHGRDKKGFDCYGIAIEIYKRKGKILHDVFYETITEESISKNAFLSNEVTEKHLNNISEDDIILINVNGNPNHIGVYIGEGLFIHSTKNFGVIIEPLKRYKKRIKGVYKVSNNQLL